MVNVTPYTIWDNLSGEIVLTGVSAKENVRMPEGCSIHWGEALNYKTWIFEDGVPVERKTPRAKSQEELSILINKERQRRIEAGATLDGIKVTGSDRDMMNLTNLALGAQLRLSIGDTTAITVFRDGDDVHHDLEPMRLIELWKSASSYVSMIYDRSWKLKAMEPIPQDYWNDLYWQ